MSTTYEAETKTNTDDTVKPVTAVVADGTQADDIVYEHIPVDDIDSDDDTNPHQDIAQLIHKLKHHTQQATVTTAQSPNATTTAALPPAVQRLYAQLCEAGLSSTASALYSELTALTITQQSQIDTQLHTTTPPSTTTQSTTTTNTAVLQYESKLTATQSLLDQTLKHYINLKKQRNYYRLNYRRVIQEKNILLNDVKYLKTKLTGIQAAAQQYDGTVAKLTRQLTAVKVDRDRYKTKCEKYEPVSPADATSANTAASATQQLAATTQTVKTAKATPPTKQQQQQQMNSTNTASKARTGAVPNSKTQTMTSHPSDSPLPSEQCTPAQYTQPQPLYQYQCSQSQVCHAAAVTSVAVHPSKPICVTASDDRSWKLHSLDSNETIVTVDDAHSDWLSIIQFHPTGQLVGTAGGDCAVKVWNLMDIDDSNNLVKPALIVSEHSQPVWDIKFHSSGDYVLSGSNDHTVKLYDLNSQRYRQTYRGHVDTVNAVAWCGNSSVFASASGDKTVSTWDIRASSRQANSVIATMYSRAAVLDVTYDATGQFIVYCDASGQVKMIDTRNRYMEVCTLQGGDSQPVNSVTYDGSGQFILTGTDSGVVNVYSVRDGKLIGALQGHSDVVQCVGVDVHNQAVVSCSSDRSYRVWTM